MVAVQDVVAVQHERDVAVRAAQRRPARAAVDRRCDAAPVEEQDRLAALRGDAAERGEQRRGERVAGLAPEVDDAHRRERPDEPPAEVEPLEPLPALRPRRRAAVDRDRALQRRALRRDGARVVARVGVLLVRLVVLLVDADQPEVADRREDRRPRADDDARLAPRDPLALVAALRIGQARVQDREPVAEARREAAGCLRRQRDLRHQHDRTEPALERRRARLEVDLGLAAAGRSREQEVPAAPERTDDAVDRGALLVGQLRRLGLAREALARQRRRPLAATLAHERRDERERARRRRAVVLGEPEREIDERRRKLLDDPLDRRDLDPLGRATVDVDDDAARLGAGEAHLDDRALLDLVGHLVGEDPRGQRPGVDERVDRGVAAHAAERSQPPGVSGVPYTEGNGLWNHLHARRDEALRRRRRRARERALRRARRVRRPRSARAAAGRRPCSAWSRASSAPTPARSRSRTAPSSARASSSRRTRAGSGWSSRSTRSSRT